MVLDKSHPTVNLIRITEKGIVKLLSELKKGKAPAPDGLRIEYLTLNIDKTASILILMF